MAKLNQIIAVVSGKKTKVQSELTESYKKLQKPELFDGFTRTYFPLAEDGETLPGERKVVQYSVGEAVKEASDLLTGLIDAVYTQDVGNTTAKADIKVEGKVLVKDVPVTHLLFLEKQLVDLRTFVSKLPVLDPASDWRYDDARDAWVTEPARTNRNKKVYKTLVKAEATDKHPAQVDVYTEEVKAGEWEVVKFSGAMPAKKKKLWLERVDKLVEAVKLAREEANSQEVEQKYVTKELLSYVFEDVRKA